MKNIKKTIKICILFCTLFIINCTRVEASEKILENNDDILNDVKYYQFINNVYCYNENLPKITIPQDTYINDEYVKIIEDICKDYKDVKPELVKALVETESGGQVYATSRHGAVGLCQLIPEYFYAECEKYGFNSMYNPEANIFLCVNYLQQLFNDYEDPVEVLMVYRGGPKEVYNYENSIENNSLKYAEKILNRTKELERFNM